MVQNGFVSVKLAMGQYVTFNCSVSGNPKPKIQWYHNGRRLRYDLIINYEEPKIIIQTFEEQHKGIYQCVAANEAGEAQVTGLLSWENKNYMRRPENVKCYPINYSSMKVSFEHQQRVSETTFWRASRWPLGQFANWGPLSFLQGNDLLYYTASVHEPKWQSTYIQSTAESKEQKNEIILEKMTRRPFEAFTLYLRILENTGYEKLFGSPSTMFDMSRLSHGVKCAIQGCKSLPVVRGCALYP